MLKLMMFLFRFELDSTWLINNCPTAVKKDAFPFFTEFISVIEGFEPGRHALNMNESGLK